MKIGAVSDIMSKTAQAASHALQSTAQAIDTHIRSAPDRRSLIEQELQKGAALSVVRLVDLIIEHAMAARASDIHLDPRGDHVVARLRIDGVLQDVHVLEGSIHNEVISRIKILSGLRTDEHQAAQDGRFRVLLESDSSVDVHVSIVPTYFGENAVLRLLSDRAEEFTIDTLGFTAENSEKILHAVGKPYGMILATLAHQALA